MNSTITLEQFRIDFSKELAAKHGFACTDLNILYDGMIYTKASHVCGRSPAAAASAYAKLLSSLSI